MTSVDFTQYCKFQLLQSGNKTPLNVCLVYRSPNSNTDNDNSLNKVIEQTKRGSVIFGDFNMPKVGNPELSARLPLIETAENKFLRQIVDFKTHIKGGLLDLCFTDLADNVISIEDIGNLSNSDHCIIKLVMNNSPKFNKTSELVRDWRKGDQIGLVNHVKNIDFPGIFQGKNANECWESLKEETERALDRYVPLAPRRKPGDPPWLTQGVKRITRKKNRYWKRFAKNRSADNFVRFKEVEKECKRAVHNAKRNFEKKIADSGNKRPFNSYVKSKTKSRQNVGPLKVNDRLVTENGDMAQELNNFLTSVFTREGPGPLPSCDKLPSASVLTDMHISSETVKKKIMKLKPGSAPGPDKITAGFLIENVDAMAPALAVIFNKSLETGVVPEDWKTANVTPIFKKGSKSKPGNYRPVSLTPIPCRLMESCMRDVMVDHLVTNALIKDSQHGFMRRKSCTTNLLQFLEKLTAVQDQGHSIDVIYLDFAKAFDKVPHRRLLEKFKAHSIDGKILKWVENWLSGRKQRTVLNGEFSGWGDVWSGVPQGSVLGPLAFVIFINDIDLVIRFITLMNKFADDTKIANTILTNADVINLQDCLDRLVDWADTWGMQFNVDKCKVMHIGRHNQAADYTMSGTKLGKTPAERDIGVKVQQSLRPSLQCSEASNRANAVLGQITRAFHFRDRNVFIKLYKQYVRPHLEFAVPAWSPWTLGDKEMLEKIQRRAVRQVSGLKGSTYEEKLLELDMLSLEARRTLYDQVQTFKMIRGVDDVDYRTWFTLAGDAHTARVTRQTSDPLNIVRQHPRNEIRRSFFSVRVADTWNSLPSEIKHCVNVNVFKKKVRELLKNNSI